MSKIICDICGTKYPDTADQCPICGCTRDQNTSELADELVEEELTAAPARRAKGGRFAAASGRKSSRKSRYEEEPDEYDDDDEEDDLYESDYDDDDEDEDDDHKSNAPLVVALIIVIAALLAVTGFIFVKYFLPGMMPEETAATTAPVQTTAAPEQTEEPTIPCESLVMTSGGTVELTEVGQNWLINVMALPDNTTDKLTYTTSDPTVAIVSEDGKITAIGEGQAVITITCGDESLVCNVICSFSAEETTAPTEAPTEAPDETEETEPTEATEPSEPTEPLKDITLKVLQYTDLTFNAPGQGFTFVLDGLKNNEVKWISQDESIVTVDENGLVISVGAGNTTIICQYGDQKVEIKITCRW